MWEFYFLIRCSDLIKTYAHWIYGSDNKDKFSDIMTMDALKDKLKDVT